MYLYEIPSFDFFASRFGSYTANQLRFRGSKRDGGHGGANNSLAVELEPFLLVEADIEV
jgi:hypothetical protein